MENEFMSVEQWLPHGRYHRWGEWKLFISIDQIDMNIPHILKSKEGKEFKYDPYSIGGYTGFFPNHITIVEFKRWHGLFG